MTNMSFAKRRVHKASTKQHNNKDPSHIKVQCWWLTESYFQGTL